MMNMNRNMNLFNHNNNSADDYVQLNKHVYSPLRQEESKNYFFKQ